MPVSIGIFPLIFWGGRNFLNTNSVTDFYASWHVNHLDLARNTFGTEDNNTLGHTVTEYHAHDRQNHLSSFLISVVFVRLVVHTLLHESVPKGDILLISQLGEVKVF